MFSRSQYSMILLAALSLLCAAVSAEFRLPPLPFDPAATEPVISAQANKFHHDNHHAGYVSNTNKLLEEERDEKLKSYTLSELVAKVGSGELGLEESKEQKLSQISDDLAEAIKDEWGSVDKMIDEMKTKANGLFGSGWAWLIVKGDKIAIVTTPNQDNPLMSLVPEEDQGIPIFGIDVWEHAFYLTYGPTKPKFTEDFWQVVDWKQVNKNYQAAKKGKIEDLVGKEFNEYM
ncbi:superoxide dismutase [Dunaliella salina]|uniref:Superoxide dismutase n=1 Tax=Dunaliella salina TaxID=3046 RepID=A0ABQ7G9X5_DUNSA|nr:superoxide dismutase [Dunaliella salina]|eukprot:KAF5831406.1 superoxide dismutase [Dunaliella salina]